MRLAPSEIDVFVSVLGSRLDRRSARLYLFGSRVRDGSKGGDIDLLVLASADVIRSLRKEKHCLLAEFEAGLGERRIDLVLADAGKADGDPFLKTVLSTAVLLKTWK